MNNRDRNIIIKILEEIEYLELHSVDVSFEDFISNETLKRAFSMTLINIGEKARLLSEEFRESVPDIPYNEIIATRNIAAHGYEALNFNYIWDTIKADIPVLKEKISVLIKD